MRRRISTKNQALVDQLLAILRDGDGFPLSTGDIARQLGDRLVAYRHHRPLMPRVRPACWPDGYQDEGLDGRAFCWRCDGFHVPPIWRNYDAQDIRYLLNRLARDGEVEKVLIENIRHHYWRAS